MTGGWRRWSWGIAAAAVVVATVWASSALWQARDALRQAETDVRSGESLAFERKTWTPPGLGVTVIDGPPNFRSATEFAGRVYLAGDGGIRALSDGGAEVAAWRAGYETPPAPVTDLGLGLDPARGGSALFAATAGEGLLVISEAGRIEQIRASKPELRDLTALLPLDDGRVLLGTQQAGVVVWDAGGLAPLHEELRDLHVTCLAGDEAELWIGTLDAGAVRFAGGRIERIGREAGLPDDRVFDVAVTDEAVYVATAGGVAEVRNGRVARTLAEGVIAASVAAEDSRLFIGTFDQGVAEIELDLSRRSPRASWRDEPPETRSLARLGGDLHAVAADGLYPLGSGAAVRPPASALSDRNVSALRRASDGRLWVGYFDRGLDVLDAGGSRLAHVENDTVFCVNRIVEDEERGVVYVATANGLALFSRDGRLREVWRKQEGLIADHVTDVALRDGEPVAATPAGLTFFGAGGARSLYALQGLVNNHVYALGVREGRLLAGTLGGLSLLEGDVVRRSWTTASSALGHNWITAVAEWNGDWFLGTYGAGVVRLRKGEVIENPRELAGVEINPNALAVGRTVFAGSLDRGLLVLDPETERWFAHTQGLPSANVTAVEVAGGVAYIGTDNGLVSVPETSIMVR